LASATIEQPGWLTARRERAASLTETLDLPTYKGKPGWEFTDISSLDLAAYAPAGAGSAAAVEGADTLFVGLEQPIVVTQVDAETVEVSGELPDGVVISSLEQAAASHPELVEQHLGTIVAAQDAFVVRNDAAFAGGLFVHVGRGVALERPLLVTVVQDGDRTALNWRSLIVLEDGAQAEVWEQYLSAGEDRDGLFNTVVELVVGDNANLRFVNGQNLSEKSWIFGSQRAEVGRDGALDWVSLGFGSARGKVRTETKLAGKGADGKVTGAYASHKRQHIDFDTTQEHAAPNTTSNIFAKSISKDGGRGSYRGLLEVAKGAHGAKSKVVCDALLLDEESRSDTYPTIRIGEDDVDVGHEATVSKIGEEQIFYLQSHGIDEEEASKLIVNGFIEPITKELPMEYAVEMNRLIELQMEGSIG
jgi:Fe-S cluster assembly protein SufD